MQQTLSDLAQCLLATIVFSIYLLPPGYCWVRLLGRFGWAHRSREERLLWSVVFSVPLALVLAELLGRLLPSYLVQAVFIGIALSAILLHFFRPAPTQEPTSLVVRRETRVLYGIALAWTIYAALALLFVTWKHHVFLPAVIYDWSVRIPLVRSAMHGAVPPLNPLSSLDATPSALRYYYFWYVLCALPAELVHVSPIAAFTASSVWSGYALLSVFFLSLRYLEGFTTAIRSRCVQVVLPIFAIGLDILPAISRTLHADAITLLDMEWWRSDRTPSLITTLLYAPHHLAGLTCCITAMIALLTLVVDSQALPLAQRRGRTICATLIVGISFAACVGTSTYMAFVFVVVCACWCVEFLLRRDWLPILCLGGAAVLAYIFARPFLHEMASQTSAVRGFAIAGWRSHMFAAQLVSMKATHHQRFAKLLLEPIVLLLDFLEFGFFSFVLFNRFRRDFLRARFRSLSLGHRALWAILVGGLFNALFVSSRLDPAAPNDLGMHAGIIVRFVLIVWSVAYMMDLREKLRPRSTTALFPKLVAGAAAACLVLGVAGTLYGMFNNRFYLPLVEARVIRTTPRLFTEDAASSRLYDVREALEQVDRRLPAEARIQFDPTGVMQPAYALWSPRQIIAFDSGCGTSFGGDYNHCTPVIKQMHAFFGTVNTFTNFHGAILYAPSGKTTYGTDFDRICHQFHLSVVLVDSTNPEWQRPDSWVWSVHPYFENATVRVLPCTP